MNKLARLMANSRFWILSTGLVLSLVILGIVQYQVPSGSLQTIRLEQTYGFVSLFGLYVAMVISPLTKVFPNFPKKDALTHARRAIGVLTFYYACLHAFLGFFKQLGGFRGTSYYNHRYELSLLLAIAGLTVLFFMAATSLDWAVRTMGFKNWKMLHRLVYIASVAILLHVVIIGTNYLRLTWLGVSTYIAAGILLVLELIRIFKVMKKRDAS